MEAITFFGCSRGIPYGQSKARNEKSGDSSSSLVHSITARTFDVNCKSCKLKKELHGVPSREPSRNTPLSTSSLVKLLTRVEQLKLISKAEKAGLLSATEKFGLSLSTIEKLAVQR